VHSSAFSLFVLVVAGLEWAIEPYSGLSRAGYAEESAVEQVSKRLVIMRLGKQPATHNLQAIIELILQWEAIVSTRGNNS
jgi:hypothetical protein